MFKSLDHLIIAVEDIEKAAQNYQLIMGAPPVWSGEHKSLGTSNTLFNFQNTYLELLSATGEGLGADLINYYLKDTGEGLIGMVFATNDINEVHQSLQNQGFLVGEPTDGEGINSADQKIRKWKNLFLPPELTRGTFSFLIEHTEGTLPIVDKFEPSMVNKLDHVVINTNDADGFINVYEDVFNIRLALDKFVDEWKSRMLFFRLNKTTIEVLEKKNDEEPKDSLWGLSWEVDNIEEAHKRLEKAGVEITPIKKGIKEFTGVGRRYEKADIKINSNNKILIDDYGHHPIEILSNIKACKEEFPRKKICMIFQPHRFSRTAQLFDDFIQVLKKVDSLIMLDIYAASENPIRGIDSRTIVETLKQKGHKDVSYIKKHNDVIKLIESKENSFDVLITQGAGSVSSVCELIKETWKK